MNDEDTDEQQLIPVAKAALQKMGGFDQLLENIRPVWQSRSLITRVRTILPYDPSSACQRLFNAAIHDLREKIVISGIDLAREAAKTFKLPNVETAEDIEEYPTKKLIDLSYRIGLLTRPEWRRLQRAYEILRHLEHEDDEYEATVEDCVYIFRAAIESVLSRDPIQLLRVADVKALVEGSEPYSPSVEFLSDYEHAPQPRQQEICQYLVSTALSDQADIIRQKAVEALRTLEPLTQTPVGLEIARQIQERVARKGVDLTHAKVANAIGALPYLKKTQLQDFFRARLDKMKDVGYGWREHSHHDKLLSDLEDVGGW